MTKAVKEIIIVGVLLVVLAVLVINNLKGGARKKPKRVQKPQQVGGILSHSLAVSADKKIIKSQKERAETLAWDRDPFQYLETKADKSYHTDALVLKGISLGKDKIGFAFINNEIVKAGDTIGGYEVVQIQRDKVLLKRESQVFYLTLPE